MPSTITKRGKRRVLGTVWVQGVRGPTKLYPDASKDSYREAIEWENEERKKLRRQLNSIHTESFTTIRLWANKYLNHVMTHNFAKKTYDEKKGAFERFVAFDQVTPDMPVDKVDRFLCADYFNDLLQTKPDPEKDETRSGNSVNKDRKNLGAAWSWGKENLRGWPENIENPFLAVAKKAENRVPRYVPPEDDFWAVYNYVSAIAEDGTDAHLQDRVMLLAYLHLAARRDELFRAKWADVDFGRGQIRLWTRKREGGGWEFDWLPLTSELAEELEMWSERRQALPIDDKKHVFVCLSEQKANEKYYGRPFKHRQRIMKRWCTKAKVEPFGWHAIRHLTASTLYGEGYPKSAIQAILRHKSASTTSRYLRTLGFNEVREVLERGLKRDRTAEIIPFEQKKAASGRQS